MGGGEKRRDGERWCGEMTCSIVRALRLIETRTSTTSTSSSTSVDCTSSPVSGAKRISSSCGY
jgi:hypothetical protein